MTNFLKNYAVIFVIALIFSSCTDDNESIPQPLGAYENGILITHEGSFGSSGFGTVSFVSNDLQTVENNIFENVNGRQLGSTVQSMTFFGNFAYIIVNFTNEIEIVNRFTFESVATIDTQLSNPRYITIANGKGYITNWGTDVVGNSDDFIAVLDLASNTITGTFNTNFQVEDAVVSNNKIFLASTSFGGESTIRVINTGTDSIDDTVTVGNEPSDIKVDGNGNVWVLSSDNLIQIDATNNAILKTISFNNALTFNRELAYDNGSLYVYDAGSVFKIGENDTQFPTTEEFNGVSFYEFTVNNNTLYGLDAGDFISDGDLSIFDLSTNTLTETFTLSLIPGKVYFN